jgi:hypothetical protein
VAPALRFQVFQVTNLRNTFLGESLLSEQDFRRLAALTAVSRQVNSSHLSAG